MCGICGYYDMSGERKPESDILVKMADTIAHRGPDSSGYYVKDVAGFGFRRLSLIDLEGGHQPLYNEDHSLALICNGEIYNYKELREVLIKKGHSFRTNSDVEVILHLYEERGFDFLNDLNGQFAFALYDAKKRQLILARDQFGINPLYYTIVNDTFIFGSEIKALLAHPLVKLEVDLTGLDQVLTFPGVVSPRTMFKGINSLKSGHYITVQGHNVQIHEYWDLVYPKMDETVDGKPEDYYVERMAELLFDSVRYRLHADVPVGFYLSGGLDSSLIGALTQRLYPGSKRHSFSIDFEDKSFSEARHQQFMARHLESIHHEIVFDWREIGERLASAVYHSECPIKETYNTANLALSEAATRSGIKAILTGEGADELFAGYVGYRFDRFRQTNVKEYSLETVLEDEVRSRLWGDSNLFYEKDYNGYDETKMALYSITANEQFRDFNCLNFDLIDKTKIAGRHYIHQRSYLDFKLRLADHLLSDHGDKMALANSMEARYPFLDLRFVEFAREIPSDLKLNHFTEKYVLRRTAERLLPPEIAKREKYAFTAPGSPYLLGQKIDWVEDMLSTDRIKKEGYFNPSTIETLKQRYRQENFSLNIPFESDLLIVVLTFGVFLEQFNMPHLN
jgi:asparagine synthase (glutamine-hydrolysing)